MLKQEPKLKSEKRPNLRRRWWRYLLLGLSLFLVLIGLVAFATFQTVKTRAAEGMAHFQAVLDWLKAEDKLAFNTTTLNHFAEELEAAETDFRLARESLGGFEVVLPLAGWSPGPGYDVANLAAFLELAERTARLGQVALEGIQPALLYFEFGSGTGEGESKLLKVALALASSEAQARLTQATQLAEELVLRRRAFDRTRLSLTETRKALDQLDRQLPALQEVLHLLREWSPLLPELLGQAQPATYLALLQNSDELRPTGGFISAVGLVNLDKGRLSLTSFKDSYALDNPKVKPEPPPEPLAQYMQAGYFLLRDANWWPDFPTSAQQVAWLYELHQGRKVDNVVALDMQLVAYLFEALGPLELPDYYEYLTAQNFEERLRYYYLPPGSDLKEDWWVKRKEFTGVVLSRLLGRLNQASARDYLKLANRLGQALAEKHLQLYFKHPALEDLLIRSGLDGGQSTESDGNDYLMVVESNVGFNKVNPNIGSQVSYRVAHAGDEADFFASLTLTYTNYAGVREGTLPGKCIKVVKYDSSYASMMNGCYWNYLRVYVPIGSRLRQAVGFSVDNYPVTGVENNRTVFASQLVVPPGQTLSVTFDYVLPPLTKPDYKLIVQKQAGKKPFPLELDLRLSGFSQHWSLLLEKTVAKYCSQYGKTC
ncbi:MAG: DUF4012 domain-containing protein [Chloroflexi bacterium]|nr:DUF4012 domain-containing protein [Chloroflexota bacterium]